MADHPMLYSAPMVRGLIREANARLTGKRQTRRISKDQPPAGVSIIRKTIRPLDGEQYHAFERRTMYGNYGGDVPIRIKRGDRIWVRETLAADSNDQGHRWITYAADGATPELGLVRWDWKRDSVPSIHMPRWMSRLTLTVTDVRIERLQDISREDAIAEGLIKVSHAAPTAAKMGCDWGFEGDSRCGSPVSAYAALWDHINGEGAWQTNPWVVAYTFSVQHGNIDQIAKVAA